MRSERGRRALRSLPLHYDVGLIKYPVHARTHALERQTIIQKFLSSLSSPILGYDTLHGAVYRAWYASAYRYTHKCARVRFSLSVGRKKIVAIVPRRREKTAPRDVPRECLARRVLKSLCANTHLSLLSRGSSTIILLRLTRE